MNKKSLIICICLSLLLLAAIGLGVWKLYSGQPASSAPQAETVSHAALLQAVPADAALVFCFQNARSGVTLLSDRTKLFRSLAGASAPFAHFVASLEDSVSVKAQPMAVSVHYSETLVPLMVLESPSAADTSDYERGILDYAASCGLQAALEKRPGREDFLLLSPSATLVESAVRHLESGTSILDDDAFADLAGRVSAREAVYFANGYLGKVVSALCLKPVHPHAAFLKGAADWTGFAIRESDAKRLRMTGGTAAGRSPAYYANLLEALPGGEARFPQALPANTLTATALCPADFSAYAKAYEKWLDASQSLQGWRRACDTLKKHGGEDPVKSFARCGIVEAVSALLATGERVVLLRLGKAPKPETAEAYPWAEAAPVLFGDVFQCSGTACRTNGDWLALGSERTLDAYAQALEEKGTLAAALSDVSLSQLVPSKGMKAAFYFSASDAQPRYAEWFRPQTADQLRSTLEEVIWEPMLLACTTGGLVLEAARPVDYAERKASGKRSEGRKADVEVPAGPFEVTNCGTGKANLFYQSPNGSLCLKDKESGKGLWGVSFDRPICGAVSCIDYYANGKLQFLFAAGSSLYLIDRLGRFVSGFPVDLGKEVLVGPDAYDFTGAGGYTAIVLHRDNTVGMYDMHGVQPAAWQGIACEDTILGLPVLAKADGKRVWVVRTAGGERVYDFWGGEPLKMKNIKNLEYQQTD